MYNTTKPYTNTILELIKNTWETPYVSVKDGLVRKKFDFFEYHHSDGIGTKGIYHWKKRTFENFVRDALAMGLNDLLLERARAYAVIDHLLIPEDDYKAVIETMKYLSEECKKRDIAITGGETAIHNNMIGLEISLTLLGFVEKPLQNKFREGDVLIGLASNGLHSNGFTKIREIFREEFREDFIKPTFIYYDSLVDLIEEFDIHGMMHITGGAFTKLRGLSEGNVKIKKYHNLKSHDIFQEIYERGVSDEEMYKTFNCGIGFVLGIDRMDVDAFLSECFFSGDVIGEVVSGKGEIKIESIFSDKEVVF